MRTYQTLKIHYKMCNQAVIHDDADEAHDLFQSTLLSVVNELSHPD